MPPRGRKRKAPQEEPGSETERPARRRRDATEEDDEENDDVDLSMDSGEGEGAEEQGERLRVQLVKKMLRYVLSCQHSKTPIRKNNIKTKILGTHSKLWRVVFPALQDDLRHFFGMELREHPTREKTSMADRRKAAKAAAQESAAQRQARLTATAPTTSASGSLLTSAQRGANQNPTYTLTSTLPRPYRAYPIAAPAARRVYSGHVTESSPSHRAFVAIVIALVSLHGANGGPVSQPWLTRQLDRFGAADTAVAAAVGADGSSNNRTENVLARMARMGYLVKVQQEKPGGGGWAAAAAADGGDDANADDNVYWAVGPRARVEFGPEGVANLVLTVWGADARDPRARRDLIARLRSTLDLAGVTLDGEGAEGADEEDDDGDVGRQDEPAVATAATRRRPATAERARAEDEEEEDEEEEENGGGNESRYARNAPRRSALPRRPQRASGWEADVDALAG